MKLRFLPAVTPLIGAAFALTLSATPAISAPSSPAAAAVTETKLGAFGRNLNGVDQYGREVRLSDLEGKYVIVNFVAAWSPLSAGMAVDTQALTNFLRQNHVPVVYLTVLLEGTPSQIATEQNAIDWAAQYGITEPVLSPLSRDASTSELWQFFFGYQDADNSSNSDSSPTGLGPSFPYVALIGPDQGLITLNSGTLSPQDILQSLGQGSLNYTSQATPPAFSLDGFTLGFGAQPAPFDTGESAVNGSRTEPTTATGFTAGNLPTTLTCDSTGGSDTAFRATRTFVFGNFGGSLLELGSDYGYITLSTSAMQWGASGPGFFEPCTATVSAQAADGTTEQAPLPFTTQANGDVTVGPFDSFQVFSNPDVSYSFDQLTISLQWTQRADPVARLFALENEIMALPLPAATAASLLDLVRSARLDSAPGSVAGRAVAELHTLSAQLSQLAGLQIDSVEAAQLVAAASQIGGLLTAKPPAPAPAVVPNVAATAASGVVDSPFAIGKPAPDFAAMSQQGPLRLSKLRGKWVLLDFCAAWCGPCNAMAVNTRPLVDTLKGAAVPFQYVSVLLDGNTEGVPATQYDGAAWALDYGLNNPIVTREGNASSILETQWGLYTFQVPGLTLSSAPAFAVPLVVVIDPAGRIAAIEQGIAQPQQIMAMVQHSDLRFVDNRKVFSLNSYEADLAYDGQTAVYQSSTMANFNAILSPDSGTAPSTTNLERFTYSTNQPEVAEENIEFGVNLASTTPTVLDATMPISLTIKNPTWGTAGPGLLLLRDCGMSLVTTTSEEYALNFSNVDPRVTGDPVLQISSISAITGLPEGVQIASINFQPLWISEDPDSLLPYLLRHLTDLKLPPARYSALQSPIIAAIVAYQVQGSPKNAIAQLERCRALLGEFGPSSGDPLMADWLVSVSKLLLQELSAP